MAHEWTTHLRGYWDDNGGGGGPHHSLASEHDTMIQFDEEHPDAYDHRQLSGAASMGQYIAFQLFRILLPLMVFIFCFWCHDNSRRGREHRDHDARVAMMSSNGQGGGEMTEEQREASEFQRKSMLAETLVFKGVVEADEENPIPIDSTGGDNSALKGDIYIPKSSSSTATNSTSATTTTTTTAAQLMEDPFTNEAADDDELPTCSICMVEYERGETICWSPNPDCTHAFHWECMSQWLLKHDDCPQCRNNYLSPVPKSSSSSSSPPTPTLTPAGAGVAENAAPGAGTVEMTAVASSSTFVSTTPPSSPRDLPSLAATSSSSSPSRDAGESAGSGSGAPASSSSPAAIVERPTTTSSSGSRSGSGAPAHSPSSGRGGGGGGLGGAFGAAVRVGAGHGGNGNGSGGGSGGNTGRRSLGGRGCRRGGGSGRGSSGRDGGSRRNAPPPHASSSPGAPSPTAAPSAPPLEVGTGTDDRVYGDRL